MASHLLKQKLPNMVMVRLELLAELVVLEESEGLVALVGYIPVKSLEDMELDRRLLNMCQV